MAAGGCFGRALVVDAGSGVARVLDVPERVQRSCVGGVGLGTWLIGELAGEVTDPLSPEAPIAFVFSPLVGTPLTTSAKFAVVALSPLTGLLTDALASSHFALAGKATGYDALVLVGRAADPATVLIDDGVVTVEPTRSWGASAAAAEAELRERCGRGWQVASIGVAGERGVAYATISHDGRHAGRGGLGAVLGSKNVKALAVRGTHKTAVADPAGVLAAARDLRGRSRGRATERYRELGTMGNVLAFNALSTLPTRNFQQSTFEGAASLGATELAQARAVTRSSCASCSIGCEHLYADRAGKRVRMEHQSVSALGSLCGVADAERVIAASALCDELGVDTISAGGTIAWAMECVARGLLDAPWLRFGDGEAVLRALREIGEGTPLGTLLARGSRAAAHEVGHGSLGWAAQVKGLELPGYEPRTMQSMALGLAVNARGADHNRSGAFDADLSGDLDRLRGGAAHVAGAVEAEDRAAMMDSLILCSFLRKVFTDPWVEWSRLLSLVTGWDVSAEELQGTAGRIVLSKRAVNTRHGWSTDDDWLPERFLSEELTMASGRTAGLTAAQLRSMIAGYYEARGLTPEGLAP